VVDKKGRLTGLITIKDIEKIKKFPNASKDTKGGCGSARRWRRPDMEERAEAL